MMNTIEFRWNLLDIIKHSSEDWELDEGNESGINRKFDCVKSFMDTDVGIVRDVEVLCGKVKYPTDFLVLSSP